MKTLRVRGRRAARQAGQAFLIIAVVVAIFLLGVLGLATDFTQIWAHRQMAQGAADAACQAGAADIYLTYINPTAATTYGFDYSWIGNPYDCSTNTTSSPCKYASLNGYSGSNVSVSFPRSLAGVPPLPAGFGSVTHPYIKVSISDPVSLSFSKLVTSMSSVSVAATAGCGLAEIQTPIPLIVLHPSASGSMGMNGTPLVKIYGGPNRSVQVDSSSSTAVNLAGGATVDLTQAGPDGTGSDFGVFGSESQPGNVTLGTGKWISPATPYGDPWALINQPSVPGAAGTAIPQPFGWDGCPDPNGCVEFTPGNYTSCSTSGSLNPGDNGCLMLPYGGSNPRFSATIYNNWAAGTYATGARVIPTPASVNACGCAFQATPGGATAAAAPAWSSAQTPGQTVTDNAVTWTNIGKVRRSPQTAIFVPGLYYLGANGLIVAQNSTVRMAAPPSITTNTWRGNATVAAGDGSSGATFYFSTSASASVAANSGAAPACTSASSGTGSPNNCIVTYNVDGSTSSAATGQVPNLALQCPGGSSNPSQVSATSDGNVLFGPCSGTYAASAAHTDRGFLFFQNRSTAATASWGGGAGSLASGFFYFHNTGSYGSTMSLSGGSSSDALTLGNIVVDKIVLGGNSGIKMILNPDLTFPVLAPSLLQ